MEIIISNSSGEPIYAQIVTQVRRMIVTGELRAGEPLPSMRQLARDLRISLITTKRAYEELETAGLIVTVGGKGCFVGEANPERLAEANRVELEKQLAAAAATAHGCGITMEQFIDTARLIYTEGKSN